MSDYLKKRTYSSMFVRYLKCFDRSNSFIYRKDIITIHKKELKGKKFLVFNCCDKFRCFPQRKVSLQIFAEI